MVSILCAIPPPHLVFTVSFYQHQQSWFYGHKFLKPFIVEKPSFFNYYRQFCGMQQFEMLLAVCQNLQNIIPLPSILKDSIEKSGFFFFSNGPPFIFDLIFPLFCSQYTFYPYVHLVFPLLYDMGSSFLFLTIQNSWWFLHLNHISFLRFGQYS